MATTTLITTNYTYPIARSSECPFALVVQINAKNTAIVSHQREERFALTNVPDFTLEEMMNEIRSSAWTCLFQLKSVNTEKRLTKTLTSCLPLAVCLRSQKLRSNAKMQNMGEEVSGCWGYQREGVRFYENLRICKCFFELKSNFILTVLSLDPLTRKSPFLSIAQTGPSCPINILWTKSTKFTDSYNHNISFKLLLLCTL